MGASSSVMLLTAPISKYAQNVPGRL